MTRDLRTMIGVSIFIFFGSLLMVTCQQQPSTLQRSHIPNYLIECYTNITLYDRDQRLPATINSLLSIIRKIEQYPGINMNIRTFAVALLRKFQINGVERDPDIIADGIVPFGPTGFQRYTQKYLFDALIPTTGMNIPNETLTSQEKCSLHFMLSSSVDDLERHDSVCGQLSTYKSRRPRSAENGPEGEKAINTDTPVEPTEDIVTTKSAEDNKEGTKEAEETTKAAQEALKGPQDVPPVVGGASDTNKTAEETKVVAHTEEQSSPDVEGEKVPENDAEEIPLPSKQAFLLNSLAAKSGKIVKQPREKSACPVENGVIYTSSGAITAGTLLAGIAAGLEPQTTTVADVLNTVAQGGRRGSLSSYDDKITNYWSATLAGDLAEVATIQGPHQRVAVGGKGGWNDTSVPKWYFLQEKQRYEMTDAEIRGGLDGLIIAKKINEWNTAFGNSLRLSQLFDMYYSERGISGYPSYRACQRNDHFTEVAPPDEMKAEALASSKVLKDIQPYFIISEQALKDFTDAAVSGLTSYMATLDTNCERTQDVNSPLKSLSPSKSLPPSVDLIIVLDAGWPYRDAMTLLSYLLDKLDLGEYGEGVGVGGGGGSTFTLMAGRNTQSPPIVNSSSTPLDFYGNFTLGLYNTLQAGMDLPQVLIKLRTMYAATMELERDRRTTTGRPQVALFITYMSSVLSDSERSAARNAYNRLRIKAPNTHFIYWTLGSKDQYQDFVIDKDKDLIQISSISDFQSSLQMLMENLNKIPRRIINPACTYRWESNGDAGKSIQYADPLGRPILFNLHPNFFFKSDKATVKFQGQGYGSLQICYSRNPIIGNSSISSSSKPSCKTITSETAEFSESQPCSGTDYISSCKQMYFSVTPTTSNPRCFDKYCRYPDMIRFTVTHEGLTCANSAKGLLLSGTSATLFVVMFSLRELLKRLFFFG